MHINQPATRSTAPPCLIFGKNTGREQSRMEAVNILINLLNKLLVVNQIIGLAEIQIPQYLQKFLIPFRIIDG